MDENTKSLYDLYIGAGHTETPEQFLDAKNQMGEEVFNTYINSQIELKKKDQTEIIPIENFSTPSIQETNQMILDNNLNQRFPELKQKEATIIPQNLLEANSTESDSILVPNSTESDSISPEKYLPKQDGFFDLLGKYKNYNPNTGVFSGKKRIIPDEEIDRATKFYDDQKAKNEQIRKQNSLNFLAGKPKDDDVVYIDVPFDAFDQEEKLNAETPLGENDPRPYLRTDRPFQKKGVEYSYYAKDPDAVRENNDELLKAEKGGWLILTTDLRTGEIATDKFGNYYHTYISDEAIDAQNKYIQSLNDAAAKENISRARYNFENLFSAPTPETETQQYLNELNKEYGITLLTPEQREQLSTAEGRKNIEIELETQKRLKENKNLNYNTVFAQVSKEKKGADIQQQITNGSNYVKRMFFGGGIATNARKSSVFGEANDGYYSADERDEYNFYVNYFNNPDNVAAFGAFMDDDGKALFDSSWIKRTNVSQNQEKRKEMFATFLLWKGKQDRLNLKFSQDALETNASKADSYQAASDLNNYRNQVSKVNFYQKKIKEASAKVQKNVNELSNSSQFYSKSNTKANEKADFQARVQNDEVSANVQNFIGNVFLGATTSIQNAVTGLLRISAAPFGKGNVNDFIDIVSEPISVGNVDIARISDEIITLNGNGKEYKKINGYLYEVGKNGKIFRPTSKIDENSLKEIDRTRNINYSGLAFVTSKVLVDYFLTKSIGAGINSQLSFGANALSNSKKITAIFGEGSQIANQAATFARTMQSPTAIMITGWTIQMYNDNYLAAKKGGIENETNRHLYAFTTSFLLAQLQRINPDTNFLKTINTEYKDIVYNLMENNIQKAILGIQSFTEKLWENTSRELGEENLQQGTQDLINIIVNATGKKNLQVSTLYDYKDLFIGTVVPSLVFSVMGGRVRQAEIGGRKVDLTQLTRNELVTELARSTQGVKLLKEFRDNAYFESQQNEAEKLVSEIQERQKYINKIPDSENYSTETINSVIPLLQEIDLKQQSKKNDDGTFTARIDAEISNLTTQVNEILDQDAETTQSTPKPEAVQEQGTNPKNQSQQGTPSAEQNTESSVENPEIIQQKIKNKNLFKDGGLFANILGGSGVDSVLSGHQERNGIEFIQWSNPNTGDVDVIMTGTGSHDFVGYYRIYENGKPTNKWSSKFENQSRNKDNFKLMISGVQELLPSNHQYTEKTSISSDGLRVWEQQLRNGYEIARNQNGEILTNEVSINGDSINNDLGIKVNQGQFLDIEVNNEQDFQNVKKALLPKLIKLGLNDSNIRWDKKLNTVKIDLPILQKIKTTSNNDNNTQNINSESQQGSITEEQNINSDIEEVESRRKKELDNLPLLPLNLDGKNPQYDIDREEQNKKREEINKRYDAEIEKLKKSNNEKQSQSPIPEQSGITATPSEIGNTPTTTSENLQTEVSENSQVAELPQIQINQDIFSDEVDPAELSEEQATETENQLNGAIALFESLNQTTPETPDVSQNPVTEKRRVTKNGKYNVVEKTDSDGRKTFELLDINDKPAKLTAKTKDVYVAEYINAQEYPETDMDFEDGMNENEVSQEIISKSENPKEIAQVIATTPRFDSDAVTGSKEWAIAQVIGKNSVSRESFVQNDDANNITNSIARTYFGKNKSGKSLDTIAQQASEQLTGDYSGDSVTVQDIVDFIKKYPNDPSKAERPNNPIYDAAVEKFIQLTGQNPTKNLLDKLNPKQESTELNLVAAEAEYDLLSAEAQNNLQNEYDQWFNSLPLEQKTEELQKTFYENENDSQTTSGQENNSNENESQPNRQGEGNQNVGNEETAGVQRQQSSERFSGITKAAFDALIEKLKKPFAKAFKNLNVTTDWDAFVKKAKQLGVKSVDVQRMVMAFHGSPHSFDKFSTKFMGSGEGAQAFGWGLYFTDIKSIAYEYAAKLSGVNGSISSDVYAGVYDFLQTKKSNIKFNNGEFLLNNKKINETVNSVLIELKENNTNVNFNNKQEVVKLLKRYLPNRGTTYTVSIHKGKTPEQYTWLEWDKFFNQNKTLLIIQDEQNLSEYSKFELSRIRLKENEISQKQALRQAINDYKALLKTKDGESYGYENIMTPEIRSRFATTIEELQNILNYKGDFINFKNKTGSFIYQELIEKIGSDKGASLFLLENGIDGIKYPAESISRGATSDNARGFNYVVFDDQAVTIVDKVQFMHTASGEVYGAKLPDGTIYINPSKLNANTAIHEFSHLWEQVMPNAWKKGLELFKETATGKKLFNQLKSEGNYSTLSDDLIWSEALNTHIGNIGEQQYQNPKGKMKEFVDWFKTTMAKFLNAVGIKNNWTKETNLSAFTDTVLGDLMGERELDVEGNNQNNSADFQIIGEQGARNLDSLEESTHRLDNLSIAREMETSGKSPLETRLATGWEKGVDGKWRYEIKDLSIISDDATVSGYNNLQEWFDGNKRTDGKLSLINFAGITSRQTRREAINNAKNRGFDITNIFDAYPKISEINIELSDVEDSKGSYNPRTNTITLNKKLSFKEADSTLIHEIQHAVQEIEGFASGGNYKYTTNLSNKEIQQVSQVEKAIKDAQNLKNSGDLIYESSSLSEIISSDSSIPSEIKNWAINIVSSGQNEIDNFLNETPFRKYQRLVGETEARNVQTRANMSMAERRATLLSETEDVAREDQIILMDGLGVSESNSGSSINKKAMPKSTFAAVANATSQNGREAGYQELVNSNWFKSLQTEVQKGITADNFQNTMIEQARIIQSNDKIARQNSVQNTKNKKDEVIKDIKKEFKDKISDLKKEYRAVKTKLDKITNAKERLSEKIYWRKQAVNGIKLLLNDKFIRDKVTHSELRQLLDAAEKITNARNINSAFDNFNDKIEKIIDKAEGRANKKDEWEEFKKNPEALQADPTATYNPVTGRNAIVKFKEKWFANQGGLLKPFMNMKDNARGKINWELRIAKNTVQKLLSLQNKLKYNSPDNNKTIDEALKGNNKSFDKLPDDIKPLIAQMRNQIDGLSAYLCDNNLVTPDQALNINENLGSYVTRGYDYFDGKTGTLRTAERISKKLYRFLFRKQGLLKSEFDTAKWADAVTVFQQNVLNDIAADKKFGNKSKYGEDFHNQSDLAIQSYARTKGEGDLMEYIKSLESDYQKQGSQQKADTSVLERRKDVPEPIRKLLGEYEDPKISFVLTISRMSQLAYQRKFMAQLKDQGMGSLFFRENDPNRPATHFVKIASNSNDAFAPLNGLYTTPEFKDVFLDVTEQNINDIGRLWMKATGLVKVGKTVLSPVTQMVNFLANTGFLINNGTILEIKNLGASVKVFIDDMKGSKGTDPILQELIEENIIDQNIVFNEIESDFGANIERDLMRNVRQNIAVKTARDFLSIPFRAYKASDDFFKAFTYYAEANRYSKSIFGKKYKELTGEDRIKIRKIASEVTKNTMPTYDRRYKAADYARMKTGNLLGNFLSYQAESIRTKINSIQIAVADIKNPETRSVGIQRMAGIMTYNAIYAGITSYLGKTAGLGLVGLLGFFDDDDEDEANKKFNLTIPDWARSTEKFVRKEKDGTITFYTYGNSNPYGIWYKSMNAYQNGSSNNSSGGILSVIDEVATPFFGTEMSVDWAVNTFIKEENDWGADLITWEDKARYSWEKLSPTVFKVYKDNMDENDKNNFDIYNALGIKKYNYNPTEQLGFKFRDWQTKINDLGKKKYNLEMQFANGKIKEEDAVARYEEYNNEQIEITDEFKKVYEAFIFMGADVTKLNEKANSAYIKKYNSSRDFLNYLNKNSKETEKLDLKEKGREIFSK